MVKVKIPATSANVGAGFDSLGLAVSLYNEVCAEESDTLSIVSDDGVEIPDGETNLVYVTMQSVYRICGKTPPAFSIRQTNRIPMSRGLGSSSACIVGGLLAANALLGSPLDRQELLNLATQFEGHPDNVAPALLGGFVCAVLEGKEVRWARQELPDDLRFAALIPDFPLSTVLARGVLPRDVPHRDAVYNLSRAALMSMSLACGRYENLRAASGDRLHQPYRLRLIAGAEEALAILRDDGAYCSYISGAGSTLMAMVPGGDKEFFDRVRPKLDAAGFGTWQLLMLDADNVGAVCTAI
jgi:homoserine kinase